GDFFDIIDDEFGNSVGAGPIFFGNHSYAMIPTPLPNQSIAYDKYYDLQWGWYAYVLTIEQPPSIGSSAFTTVARGSLAGYVFDLNNNPVSGATILDVYTNDSGYFIKPDLYCSIYWFLKIYYGGVYYFYPDDFIIEPYDTNLRMFQIDTLLSGILAPQQLHPNVTNHPNPFTEFTSFHIQIPAEINFYTASLDIYDLSGKLVDRIKISSFQSSVEWNSEGHKPGIYLYNVVLDNKPFATKKMIIL
ncbi:MAG: T9SS type A sorting domain-containing protein, partial [Bacteroidales bacterium]|nr:T9SS type A sorting domain-containing protein [Bacteroidales bacterium]